MNVIHYKLAPKQFITRFISTSSIVRGYKECGVKKI